MCLNLLQAEPPKPPEPPAPPPIKKAEPTPKVQSTEARELIDEEEIKAPKFGERGKLTTTGAQRAGSDSLRIPLNTGEGSAAGQGGITV